ncbi:HAD family phosphatase [Mediterraneibacter catenae]|uniref:HAD family phosphatase n=1 Tax=Mediterraneibacter catenae TaxID=2594882 RepID=A0A5M9HZF2_9FIRM|nr:HAD family phosphatase [Mediterraneibacter catenae]KAA8502324.1 HAD family phosphatase [Mediterraneibacter catenae]
MIRGVLFDMDGLMFDTEALGLKGWKAAGRKIGIEITDDMIASFRGLGSSEKRKRFGQVTGKPELYEAALAIRTNYGDEWIRDNGIPIKPGLKQLLVFLRDAGIPAALATSTEREKAVSYLKLAGVGEYFSAAVCGKEAGPSKPEPDIFLKAAEKLGLSASECMVLEDSENGLRAARAAGCTVVVVPDLSPAPAEEKGLWDWRADTLSDVPEIIRKLRRRNHSV